MESDERDESTESEDFEREHQGEAEAPISGTPTHSENPLPDDLQDNEVDPSNGGGPGAGGDGHADEGGPGRGAPPRE